METVQYQIGDMVFAAEDILNDGGMPGVDDEDGLLVPAGTRGVVVHFGHTELNPDQEIYLVRFKPARTKCSAIRSACCLKN